MKIIKHFIRTFFLLIFLSSYVYSKELKKVTLQLAWFDQFQYAGYYMAKEKGFYEELGLDVEIKPFNFDVNIVKDVNEGKIDFAVGRENLVLEKSKHKNIVALAAIFQASPMVILATKESGINTISDFLNKRLMITKDDSEEVSYKAIMISKKIDMESLTLIPHSHNIKDLVDNKTDLITAYVSKAPYWLNSNNIEYNTFYPKDYGFDMYSDFLYTNQDLINQDINTVKLFKKASLKGWDYAYSNIQESVDVILEKYNSQNLKEDELLFEAKELKKLSYFNTKELGDINKDKLRRIYDLYNVMGFVENAIDIDTFLLDTQNEKNIILTQNEEKYLKEKNFINMCVIPAALPYSDVKDGEFVGFISDYMKIIENKINTKIKFVPTSIWSESLEFIKDKKCDFIASAIKTEEREDFLSFTKPYINMPLVLSTRSDISFIDDISTLTNRTISIVDKYAIFEELQNKYKNITFIAVKNTEEGFSKVLKGEIFGHIDFMPISWHKIQTKYISKISISSKVDEKVDLAIAVNKDEQVLFEILNKAVISIDEYSKNELLNKWVVQNNENKFSYTLFFQILFVVILILAAVLYRQLLLNKLNKRLKNVIDLKTKQLRKVNRKLELRVKKEVEENLKKDRLLSQQQKMISMGQMIENIAHQWRQPLSVITTSASAVKLKKQLNILEEEYLIDSLDSIVNTSKYLSDTIDDFRYFFKPQKDKEIFDLKKCIKKSISLIAANLNSNSIQLNYNETNAKIYGYESELIQVFINVFNNSKDALIQIENEERLLFIDLSNNTKQVIIKIYDNAGGVCDTILDNIFEPYFTTKHQYQGTGIGLYMSQQIISKHMNGSITISNYEFEHKNKNYKGALATITLDIQE